MTEFFSNLWSAIDWALGLSMGADQLGALRMSLRGAVVFVVAITLLRLGNKRFMGKHTAVDVMLGIVFGSVASRAITGNAPFFATLAVCGVLVALHWAASAIAFRTENLGSWFKGSPRHLVNKGEIDWKAMARSHVTENDLKAAVRLHGHEWNVDNIESAYLERDGDISVLLRNDSSRDPKDVD